MKIRKQNRAATGKPGDKAIAEALRSARERLSETQAQFAARLGVNQGTVSRWELDGPTQGSMAHRVLVMTLADIDRVMPARK